VTVVIGWDIGGAHLKAARAENGRIVDAAQFASPLRLGLDALAAAFQHAKSRMGHADCHAITMTGELADTFEARTQGVAALTAAAIAALSPEPVHLYAGRAGFVAPQNAANHVEDIASANWHATATVVSGTLKYALFADIGSTTTDLVPITAGSVAARGYTDAERLAAGELVYSGMVRSFVMATAVRAPVAGAWTTLINENFANMADVHRLLGTLPDGADQMPTADGRAKTPEASRARLARMVGRDAADLDDAGWTGLSRWLAEAQLRAIIDGAMLVLSGARLPNDAPFVACGIGADVIAEVARRLHRPCIRFETLLDATPGAHGAASQCAPAAAVALLAGKTATARSTAPSSDA
jgi:probable H4MPT-linked C1 transfer pathway protein